MLFIKRKISAEEEAAGAVLRSARESRQTNLESAAQKLGIKKEYLEAIEAGEYWKLPGEAYEKMFLKKYSSWLGLDCKKIAALYRREKKYLFNRQEKNKVFSQKTIARRNFLVFPKIIKNFFIILFVLGLFFYLGFCLKEILSMPEIAIANPPDNFITADSAVEIIGQTKTKTQVFINNELILKDGEGNFKKTIELKKGLNTITISAQNKYSQKKIIKKQILVK